MRATMLKTVSEIGGRSASAAEGRAAYHGARLMRSLSVWGCAFTLLPLSTLVVRAQDRPDTGGASPPRVTLAGLQDAFTTVADELEPAVVTVFSTKAVRSPSDEGIDGPRPFLPQRRSRSIGTGSGVIIRKDGWILTNDHVAGGADRVTVKLHDGREFPGTVRRDLRSDLALVKIEVPNPLPAARLGDSDKLKIGHWAIAIGSPYRYEGSFSVGVISSLFRSQAISEFGAPNGSRFYPNMIQTDAAINPGNSGGPLCNIAGEVIGINTAIESENGGSIGIGFAIPINTAKFVIEHLLKNGHVRYGYLGISPQTVTPNDRATLHVEQGAYIDLEPKEDTPAGMAGLHAGDVVTAINSKPIHSALDLRTTVAQTTPGTTIELSIVRSGQPQTLKATLTEVFDPTQDKPHVASTPKLGIEVQPLTEELAHKAGVPAKTPGVFIKSVDPNTPAAESSELSKGVIVLKVNDTPTSTVQAFQEATANLKSGDRVRLYLQNERGKPFIIVSVE